jgi:hypothetical protein
MRFSNIFRGPGILALMALLLSVAGLAITAAPAAASTNQDFCWEKTLGPGGVCTEAAVGGSTHALTVKAHSTETAICLRTEAGQEKCGAAGEWIEIDVRKANGEGSAVNPVITNLSGNRSTVVKGITVVS